MGYKIAIIDPVGIKSGMNHYDNFLSKSLFELNCQPYIYSNFHSDNSQVITKIFFGTFFDNKFYQLLNFIRGMLKTCFDCKKNGLDTVIIHVFSTHLMAVMTYLFCKIFRFKIITISHDVFSFTKQDNKYFHNLIYNNWSDAIVVHNNFSKHYLMPKIDPKIHGKLHVIKHGSFVDLPDKNINFKKARKLLKFDAEKKYILFFGRLKSTKRLDLLLRAMPNIDPSIQLIIAGHSGKEDFIKYKEIIEELNLSGRLILDINYISEEKREWYFKAANCMVLPYDVIFQSGVLLMSLSYGLPVVATKIPPFEEIIQNRSSGLLFEKGNATDLAKQINLLMKDDCLRKEMPKKAVNHMQKQFSWDDIAKNYIFILESLQVSG